MRKEEKFNQVVAENAERIRRICRYYNPDKEAQKDMYQEVLINVWKSLDNFRGESALSTWIYRVAVNTSLSYTGKAFREMKLIVNSDTDKLSNIIDEQEFNEKLETEKKYELLQDELNQLSVIDKALISLMLEGLATKEIAEIIGITEPNVKVKIHRIKGQLKSKIGGTYHENE